MHSVSVTERLEWNDKLHFLLSHHLFEDGGVFSHQFREHQLILSSHFRNS